MKKLKNIQVLVLVTGIILSSCQDYLDINSDPTFPQEAPGEVLLPPMFQEMWRGEAFDSRYFGAYVQNWAHTTANRAEDLHGWFALSDALGEKWRQHYWAIGKNVDLIVEDAEANKKWWYAGAAYAIRAWSWQTTTDVYGEMILKEAWEPNRYVFDYDPQDQVYAEVVRLCNLALDYLNMDDKTGSLANGDLAYKGDRDKWKKFVYAILARNANHLNNKATYSADAVIGFVDQALASNADNFNIPHLGTITHSDGGNYNFFGPTRSNLGVYRQASYSISLVNGTVLAGVVDPRISLMFQPSTDGVYRGLTMGAGAGSPPATQVIPAPYGKYIYKDNASIPIFTYAEMQFIKAEAAFIKGDLPTAFTAYKNGISAHMDYVGVAAANRDAYLASAAVAQTSGVLTLSNIMIQKYIAMHGHGMLETWVDMRRYHYDNTIYTGFALPNTIFSTNNGKPSYRARPRYNSEYVWNIQALEKIGATALDYNTVEQWFSQP
jgi:hypothetical protein